jgi:hypothetical protein
VLAGRGVAGALRAPGHLESMRGGPVKGMERSAWHEGYWWSAITQMRLTSGDGSGSRRGKAAAAIRALGRRCWDEMGPRGGVGG